MCFMYLGGKWQILWSQCIRYIRGKACCKGLICCMYSTYYKRVLVSAPQCMALQELPVNRQGILSASEESFSYCTWSGFRMKTGFEIT